MMAESGIGMFFLRVCLFLINLITLFLAVPWTTVMYYNAWANNALIDGKRIKFTGNGRLIFHGLVENTTSFSSNPWFVLDFCWQKRIQLAGSTPT